MGQKQSLRTQLVTEIVNRPKTISALTMTGDVMAITVTSAEFDRNAVGFLSKGQPQIQPSIPKFSARFQFLPRIPMQARRRRHPTKESVDHHGRCSFMVQKSRRPTEFPTIEAKFSRMRKTGV